MVLNFTSADKNFSPDDLASATSLPNYSRIINLSGAHLVDPYSGVDEVGDLFIRGDKFISEDLVRSSVSSGDILESDIRVIDLSGKLIIPPLVDTFAFASSDLISASNLAHIMLKSGIGSVIFCPSEHLSLSKVSDFDILSSLSRDLMELCPGLSIYGSGNICALNGDELGLSPIQSLLPRAVSFSTFAGGVSDALLLDVAMQYLSTSSLPFRLTSQDLRLKGKGSIRSGTLSNRLGLPPIISEVYTVSLFRDLTLSKRHGLSVVVDCMCSKGMLDLVNFFKFKEDFGGSIHTSIAVDNLNFNINDVGDYRTYFHLDPSLSDEAERLLLAEALSDGRIDMICSNHRPLAADFKIQPYGLSKAGSVGFETLLSASLRGYFAGYFDLMTVVRSLTSSPSGIYNLGSSDLGRGLESNCYADCVIIDLSRSWLCNKDELLSSFKNSAYNETVLQSKIEGTFLRGCLRYCDDTSSLHEDLALLLA